MTIHDWNIGVNRVRLSQDGKSYSVKVNNETVLDYAGEREARNTFHSLVYLSIVDCFL